MTLNKTFATIGILLTTIFLTAWTPLETSNNSVVRLSMGDRDFCSGVVVEQVNKDFVYMATAAHCAEATSEWVETKVYLPTGKFKLVSKKVFPPIRVKQNKVTVDGKEIVFVNADARFVRWDVYNDVAIYKVLAPEGIFKPAPLNPNNVSYGDKVYAMGMPQAIWGTISSGEVTKPRLGNTQGVPNYIPQDAIVHTAYMRPGISGGGLFNDRGELIGLTNWGLPGGPFMATRISHVIDLLKVIHEDK